MMTTAITVLPVVIAAVACMTDLRLAKIPNWLTLGGALIGVAAHFAIGGFVAGGSSIAGLLVGLVLFAPLFLVGGMGAGDVKLMAALGAWLGPASAAWTALYAALAGGLLAVGVAIARGYLRIALGNIWALLRFWRFVGIRPFEGVTLATSKSPRLPYALPITAGLVLALWLH